MKAVNLIPAELRKGDSSGGHSGGGVYVVLAALGVLVVLTAAWAAMGKQINDRKNEVVALEAEAGPIEARAAALSHYEGAAAASRQRVQKVRELADGRFEWAHTLREISRTLPKEAWVTAMTGTTAPGISVEGATNNPLRAGVSSPALEVAGCTREQDSVAKLMAQLRAMDGVNRVALSSSEKTNGSGGGSGSGGNSLGCGVGGKDRPEFNLVVFFQGKGDPKTAGQAGAAAAGTPGAATPTPTSPNSGAAQ
jgi:Tfp pilus assembly protein PilN